MSGAIARNCSRIKGLARQVGGGDGRVVGLQLDFEVGAAVDLEDHLPGLPGDLDQALRQRLQFHGGDSMPPLAPGKGWEKFPSWGKCRGRR